MAGTRAGAQKGWATRRANATAATAERERRSTAALAGWATRRKVAIAKAVEVGAPGPGGFGGEARDFFDFEDFDFDEGWDWVVIEEPIMELGGYGDDE